MDILNILKQKTSRIDDSDSYTGIQTIIQHIQFAISHMERNQREQQSGGFNDVIYRTNQAFEGGLKGAYMIFQGISTTDKSPGQIEQFFEEDNRLRPRLITLLRNYRKEWRNPSTHEYTILFDESEAFIAITSVCAFSCVLIDQISERISFNKSQSVFKSSNTSEEAEVVNEGQLIDEVAQHLKNFDVRKIVDGPLPKKLLESELTGLISGYLLALIPSIEFINEEKLYQKNLRPDLIVHRGKESLIVELKSTVSQLSITSAREGGGMPP